MENEVIIDGCNVAECEFLLSNYECMSNYNCDCGEITQFDKCKDCPNCYFKQLQRVKAENEKLKEEIKDLNFYIDSYKQVWEVDKYRKALDEIKELLRGHQIADEARIEIILDLINKALND